MKRRWTRSLRPIAIHVTAHNVYVYTVLPQWGRLWTLIQSNACSFRTTTATCRMASSSTSQKKISAQTLTLSASHVAYTHTVLASTAFATALFLACVLHYKKIVKNDVARWPEEWWPSVSATWARLSELGPGGAGLTVVDRVGDWYPERNVFQILIALTSGLPLYILQAITFTKRICLRSQNQPRHFAIPFV